MQWTYSADHPGAGSGNADPASHAEWLPGAKHMNAGEIDGAKRNAYYRVPGAGQAASAPHVSRGVLSNDKGIDPAMDGHRDSALANHHDGQFALQTAASSVHSLNANLDTYVRQFEEFEVRGQRTDTQALFYGGQTTRTRPTGVLVEARAQRLAEDPGLLLVKDTRSFGVRRFGDFLTGEWQVPQLAGMALGTYALISALG